MKLDALFSLVLFAAAIVPGFIYVKVAERRVPRPERSQLLEAAELVFVSVLTTAFAAGVVLTLSNTWDVLDKNRLTDDFGRYLLDEPQQVLGAFVAMLLLSNFLAFAAGHLRYLRMRPSISQGTMWWEALGRFKETHYAHATIERTDRWIFAGQVLAYSMDPEIENRELVLRKPIHAQRPDGRSYLLEDDYMVVRGNNAAYLSVRYLPIPPGQGNGVARPRRLLERLRGG